MIGGGGSVATVKRGARKTELVTSPIGQASGPGCVDVIRDNLIHKMIVIDTHLKGTFLCAQVAQRVMVPR